MKKIKLLFLISFCYQSSLCQDNCNVFLWNGDTAKYNTCQFLQNAPSYFQLRREHQLICDSAIKIAPHYDHPYWSKSIAYLKTGDFLTWKTLIDQAVSRNQENHLGYRGWCRFQFFRDYQGAIDDLERLEVLMGTSDIGICQNGDYHLQIAKGLCYKMLGKPEEAIQLITQQIAVDPDFIGLYDYLHLGVLYLDVGRVKDAVLAFEKQEKIAPWAETMYYLAKASSILGEPALAKQYATLALTRYQQEIFLYDPYTHQIDKIYQIQIEELLDSL